MTEWKKERDDNNKLVRSLQERKQMDEEIKLMSQEINVLMEERKWLEAEKRVYHAIVAAKKKEFENIRKKRGVRSPMHVSMEKVLEHHKVERASYHGGDLTGVMVERMLQRSDQIFDEIRTKLKTVDGDERCSNDEIYDMTNRYSELCTLLDYLFSLAQTPSGKAGVEVTEELEKCARAVMRKWRDLRLSMKLPKIHMLEDHLVKQVQRWKGIGCFTEDFIEQGHQFGKAEESRTRNMRDCKRAATSHSKWEWAANDESVI